MLPESDGGNPSHQGVGRDTLQVEEAAVKKQQQHNVLTEQEALSTLPVCWDVLETGDSVTAINL